MELNTKGKTVYNKGFSPTYIVSVNNTGHIQ